MMSIGSSPPENRVDAKSLQAVEDFIAFVTRAKSIIANPEPATSVSLTFRQFIDKAMPLVFADIRTQLPRIADRANLVARWLVRHDLLAIAGCRFVENAYTELMAWALKPDTHPDSARQRQAAWLGALGLDEAICDSRTCDVRTQVRTDDGIPDLVIRFDSLTIGVEAKTGSAEHLAPSGVLQSVAYGESIRRELRLKPDDKLQMVFITPDGRQAANDDAICTTYITFAMAFAAALDGHEIPSDTRAAFAIFFTHLLTCATPLEIDVPRMVEQIQSWSAEGDWGEDQQIKQRLTVLLEAMEFLKLERQR
jgi:hypothetical protein